MALGLPFCAAEVHGLGYSWQTDPPLLGPYMSLLDPLLSYGIKFSDRELLRLIVFVS